MSNPEEKAKNTKESVRPGPKEIPLHQFTKLLGEGTWKSLEKKPHPEEGDEFEMPKHRAPEI